MNLPGCKPACPLDQFIRLTRDVIPANWERECLMNYEKYYLNVNDASIIGIEKYRIEYLNAYLKVS